MLKLGLSLLLLLSAVCTFLSLWIVIPAPNYTLLPLGVGAPEISLLLLIVNAIAFGLAILSLTIFALPNRILLSFCIFCSTIGLILSLLPLSQFASTQKNFEAEFQSTFGYNNPPEYPAGKFRSQFFSLKDLVRGIPLPQVRIKRDLVFAKPDGVELKLNTYQPSKSGIYPTIVVIYGGAWRQGSPSNDEQFSRYMAGRGYTVIAIAYRHAPKYQFPTQITDVQTALNYIYDHAVELECDRQKIALLGRSAGGHLALLAAYQASQIPNSQISIKAVVAYYAPIRLAQAYKNPPIPDPIDTRSVLNDFLGGSPTHFPERYQQASPGSYLKQNLPPTLLVYGKRDHLVEAKLSKYIYRKLKETNNLAIWLEIPWAEHAFDAIFSGLSNQLVLYYTERFIDRTLSL